MADQRIEDVQLAQASQRTSPYVEHGGPAIVATALPALYPTDPSICNWARRFISTAYSSGSSFVIGSTKPYTIIAARRVRKLMRRLGIRG